MAKKDAVKVATCVRGHKIKHMGSHKKGSDKGTEVPKECVRCNSRVKHVAKLR